jgi:phosphomannomutase
MSKIPGFKAYDIRGKVPSELNTDLAYKVGRAFAKHQKAKSVLIGRDVRESSPEISEALAKGLSDAGCNVIDLGLCGTEMIYYGTPHLDADGGIMITASHNPPEYNGLKFVKKGSKPMGYDSGLSEIEEMILNDNLGEIAEEKGTVKILDIMVPFIENLKQFYNAENIKNYKVVVNA